MDMENLAEILEEELAEAFEVKNRKSLHRYVMLLTKQHVDQQTHDKQYQELRSDIKEVVRAMEQGFLRMDERFGALQKQMDERFGALQKQMDERFKSQERRFEDMNRRFEDMNYRFEDMNHRFEDMNNRFNGLQKLISIGFVVLAFIIAAFNSALLLAS
jgi:AAA+ superfamily predicted ATPase